MTHGLFTEGSIEKVNASEIREICVTDSIPQSEHQRKCPKLTGTSSFSHS